MAGPKIKIRLTNRKDGLGQIIKHTDFAINPIKRPTKSETVK